jgi:hypothetical protein
MSEPNQPTAMKITYEIVTTETEIVEGTRVTAQARSDDYKVELSFDCTEAFAGLSKSEMWELIQQDWGYCEIADSFAEWYIESRTNILFHYLHNWYDASYVVGYEVKVDKKSALKWLEEHQPEWLQEFQQDEDLVQNL